MTEPPWSDEVDHVIGGDLAAAAAYVTPAGGVVVSAVTPCGLRDRAAGTVGFTTSLGFGKKLDRIVRDPHVALAYHTREHGFSSSSLYVLAQGTANVELVPSRRRLEAFRPSAERFVGPAKQGPVWDRILRAYYVDRLFIDVDVARMVAWPDLGAHGQPLVHGTPIADPAAPQTPPKLGTGPRVDVDKAAGRLSSLPHRLLAYRGSDGFPVVVPIEVAGHDQSGLRLLAAPGLLPAGGRRAGLLAHAFRPHLVGLSTRSFTGWLDVAADGSAVYAPHTSSGFVAPPNKNALLLLNGLMAHAGLWRARRDGTAERLRALIEQQRAG